LVILDKVSGSVSFKDRVGGEQVEELVNRNSLKTLVTEEFSRLGRNTGDVIVGLASDGQATYEKTYNGGMGSNGLTSARHDVLGNYLAGKYPESFDPSVPSDLVYSGSRSLTEAVPGTPLNVGQLILSPTRTYAPVIKAILGSLRAQIHGMVHCSGGAQTKVMHFVEGVHAFNTDGRLQCRQAIERFVVSFVS